jgi:hypothetical protein
MPDRRYFVEGKRAPPGHLKGPKRGRTASASGCRPRRLHNPQNPTHNKSSPRSLDQICRVLARWSFQPTGRNRKRTTSTGSSRLVEIDWLESIGRNRLARVDRSESTGRRRPVGTNWPKSTTPPGFISPKHGLRGSFSNFTTAHTSTTQPTPPTSQPPAKIQTPNNPLYKPFANPNPNPDHFRAFSTEPNTFPNYPTSPAPPDSTCPANQDRKGLVAESGGAGDSTC